MKEPIYFETKIKLSKDLKATRKMYRPKMRLLYCDYKFRDHDLRFNIDMVPEDLCIVDELKISPYASVQIFDNGKIDISVEFFLGGVEKRKSFIAAVNEAFDLGEEMPLVLKDIEEAFKIAKGFYNKEINSLED